MRHHEQRAVQPQTLHEVKDRLAHQRLEHAMKMERRQQRGFGHIFKFEPLPEMAHDVIDGEVDPLDVSQRS